MSEERQGHAGKPVKRSAALKRLIGPAVVLAGAGLVLLAAMMRGQTQGDVGQQTQQGEVREAPAVNVTVYPVKAVAELAETFWLPGVVEANRLVRVSAEVPGRIEQILCSEGRPCRAKDKIIVLNTDLLKAEYDRAEAEAQFDMRELQRVLSLRQSGAATGGEEDIAGVKAQSSRAAFELAKARLDRATIFAPVGGILNKLPVEVGEYVQPGDPVAEIVDVETVNVVVEAPQSDVQFLKLAAREDVLTDPPSAVKRTGEITYISELADEQSHTTRVEISVANRDHLLRSGQIVRVRLGRRVLRDVIMIPLEAVIPLETAHAVYVVEAGRAERRDVKLGMLRGSEVQVLEGLAEGDRLIVSGHRYVGPGQQVRVVSARPGPPGADSGPASRTAGHSPPAGTQDSVK